MSGTVDIFDSRRTAFEKCRWWKRSVEIDAKGGRKALERFCHERTPEGFFYVEEVRPITQTMATVGGDTHFTRYATTVSTTEDIWGKLCVGDLMEYRNRIWSVKNVTYQSEWKKSQFTKRNDHGTKIITLVS